MELSITLSIVGTLASIASVRYADYIERARVKVAMSDLARVALRLDHWGASGYPLPASLADIGYGDLVDPWGNPYQYLDLTGLGGGNNNGNGGGGGVIGQARKDRFLVPLNSDFDVYSMGKDGESVPSLAAKKSQDDVIRANDGGFFGLARDY